ncbi:MAG: PLP-dependent aminotransferase family protein [Alphaproteobacteria bacterium]
MTTYQPALRDDAVPRYQALADAIERDIVAGRLGAGQRLPPQRDLAFRLGVTVGTVGRAYAIALRRGLLSAHVGRGTFVAEPAERDGDGPVDLARNAPPPGLAASVLAESLRTLAEAPELAELMDYMPEGGHPAHRAAGARWIARSGLQVTGDQVIATGGVQQALALVLASGLAGDRPILLENLTYFGLIEAAGQLRQSCEAVAIDAEGVLPDALDAAARRTGAKLAMLVPTVHNPTTAIMSAGRRAEIAEVARRHDLILVEDDAYGFLPTKRPAPLATHAPERTIYLAGFAKCLTPGLRVGWLSAPPDLLRRLADTQRALTIAHSAIPQRLAADWIDNGGADRLLTWQRAEADARQAMARETLSGLSWRTTPGAWHGLLSLPTPWRADGFAAEARARGIVVMPARQFAVRHAAAPEAVRLALGNPPTRQRLAIALDAIADLARRVPAQGGAII